MIDPDIYLRFVQHVQQSAILQRSEELDALEKLCSELKERLDRFNDGTMPLKDKVSQLSVEVDNLDVEVTERRNAVRAATERVLVDCGRLLHQNRATHEAAEALEIVKQAEWTRPQGDLTELTPAQLRSHLNEFSRAAKVRVELQTRLQEVHAEVKGHHESLQQRDQLQHEADARMQEPVRLREAIRRDHEVDIAVLDTLERLEGAVVSRLLDWLRQQHADAMQEATWGTPADVFEAFYAR